MVAPSDVVLCIGSFISLLSCLFVIFTYLRYKPLRRHPGGIIFLKTCALRSGAGMLVWGPRSARAPGGAPSRSRAPPA